MKKKRYFAIMVLGMMIVLSACSVKNERDIEQNSLELVGQENNVEEIIQESIGEINTIDNAMSSEENIISENLQEIDVAGTWENAYKEIICSIDSNLVDPYGMEMDSNGDIYLGIHDFNDDGVPELIIGDFISVAVFTFENGNAIKIVDLYEPEEWGGINGLYFRDNRVVLVSSGSGGSCYVCFTYSDGEYVTGIYDEYNPNRGFINEQQVTGEEFNQLFNLTELISGGRVEYSRIYEENEIKVMINNKETAINDIDFQMLEW